MPYNEKAPEWFASGIEPPSSLKTTGYQPNDEPASQHWNWMLSQGYKSIKELQDESTPSDVFLAYQSQTNDRFVVNENDIDSNTSRISTLETDNENNKTRISSIEGKFVIPPTVTPSLLNGVTQELPTTPVEYRKSPDGLFTIQGSIKFPNTGTFTAFNVGVGFRPKQSAVFTCTGLSGSSLVPIRTGVDPNGNFLFVVPQMVDWVRLDSIKYIAVQ